jgi:uncharacterized protein YeaO (DUF488 family)
MLSRYQMARGVPASALPKGLRQDTRKHTRHVLRPNEAMVKEYLAAPTEAAWQRFARAYRALLDARFAEDRSAFDELAELARTEDVFLGCSCPTKHNPDVRRCHTWLALELFRERYPDLEVRMPVEPPSAQVPRAREESSRREAPPRGTRARA